MPKPVPNKPSTKEAGDVETGVTKIYSTATQLVVDRLQALCNEKVQAFLDPHGVYSHLIIYLQQFTLTGVITITTQQASVLQSLVSEAHAKGFIDNKAVLLAAIR